MAWRMLRVDRIFTVCQDFWMCVETSVSVFVVLELDDRILPMMREDLKRCDDDQCLNFVCLGYRI